MKDEDKITEQLISGLAELRQRIAELEGPETKRKQVEKALRESNPIPICRMTQGA